MASQQDNLEEVIKTVESHEQYLHNLRTLREGVARQGRQRSDTQVTINEAYLPPERGFSGPVFSADVTSSHQTVPISAQLATLDAPHRPPSSICPSPRPLPLTPNPGDGDYAVHDEDLTFIPLLDNSSSANQPRRSTTPTDETPRTTKPLTPLSFTDDMLLKHLRDSEFWGETARLLEEVLKRRDDMDLAVPFRDFAAYEREGYLSATFEVYDVAADATARKTSVDVDVQGLVKYAGDGPFESQDEIVDAPMVWESIKEVNSDGQSVGRITLVSPRFIMCGPC